MKPLKLPTLRLSALLIVSALACFGALHIKLRSPLVEITEQTTVAKPAALPQFALSGSNKQRFWDNMADEAGEK